MVYEVEIPDNFRILLFFLLSIKIVTCIYQC